MGLCYTRFRYFDANAGRCLLRATVEERDGRDVVTAFERDAFGRITAEVQDGARIAYTLDPRGRVTSRTLPADACSRSTRYALHTEHGGLCPSRSLSATGPECRSPS